MIIMRGDEVRATERIARLIGRYAERFDPTSRAEFYASLAAKVGRMLDDENEFIYGDDKKKAVASEPASGTRKRA